MFTGVAAIWIIAVLGLSAIGFIISRAIIIIHGIRSIDKDSLNKEIEKNKGITLKALEQREMPQSYREEHLRELENKPDIYDPDRERIIGFWDLRYKWGNSNIEFLKWEFQHIVGMVYGCIYTDESRTYEKHVLFVMYAHPELYEQLIKEYEIVKEWMHENRMIYTCSNYLKDFMRDDVHPKVCEMLQEDIPLPEDFRAARPNTTSEYGQRQIAKGIGRCCFKENILKEELSESVTAVGGILLGVLTVLCFIGAISSGSVFSPLGFITVILSFATAIFINTRQSMAERTFNKLLSQEKISYEVINSLGSFDEKNPYYKDDYVNFELAESPKYDSPIYNIGFDWHDKNDFEKKFKRLTAEDRMYIRYIIQNSRYLRNKLRDVDLS